MGKTPEQTQPKINWSAIKTNIIIAFVAVTVGLIGGYFTSINVRADARASVVGDIQIVAPLKTSK